MTAAGGPGDEDVGVPGFGEIGHRQGGVEADAHRQERSGAQPLALSEQVLADRREWDRPPVGPLEVDHDRGPFDRADYHRHDRTRSE